MDGARNGSVLWKRRLRPEGESGPNRFVQFLATGATLWPETAAFSPELAEANPPFRVLDRETGARPNIRKGPGGTQSGAGARHQER